MIVLLKAILLNNAILMVQPPPGQQHPANIRANGPPGQGRGLEMMNGDTSEPSLDELDFARTREIVSKAVSGILLLLLKWLKVSRECHSFSLWQSMLLPRPMA